MTLMRLCLGLWCLLLPLFGSQTLQILDQHSHLKVSKALQYLDEPLDVTMAYDAFEKDSFKENIHNKQNLDFKKHPIWLGVEISNNSTQETYFGFNNPSLELVEYYVFKEGIIVAQGKIGTSVPAKNNAFLPHLLRIPLIQQATPLVYLMRVESSGPLVISAALGTDGALQSLKLPSIIALSVFSGIFMALFLYNCALFVTTKQRDYILYSLYILALYILMLSMSEFLASFWQDCPQCNAFIKLLALQSSSTFLIFFSLNFLGIKHFSLKIYHASFYVGIIAVGFMGFSFLDGIGYYIGVAMILAILTWVLFLGFVARLNHVVLASYFLLAVGGFYVALLLMFMMMFGVLPYTEFQFMLPMIGSSWEMILFSLALGYKIRLLSLQNAKAFTQIEAQNKMLFLQSRYTSVGELIRNITHQWKEPLGEMGAIQTNLKSTLLYQGEVSKEKLLNSIELSHRIITHLSETIDTFYRFFRSQSSEQYEFNVVKEIDNVRKIVKYAFETEQIELRCSFDEPYILLYGNPNEFSHALLNIILNAKEVLIKRDISNPFVHIHTGKNSTSVFIDVEDNAGGIAQEPIEKIFDIGISSHTENIGLGLFITKTITEQKMHGTLSVANTQYGAKFTFCFPLFSQVESFSQRDFPLVDIEADTLKRISKLEKDIERHIEVEKNLQHWAEIFEKAHWGIAIYEANSKTLSLMNPAFINMYGYDEEEFKHSSFASLFTEDWVDALDEVFEIVDKTHQHSFEADHVKKNGQSFPVDVDIIAVKTEPNALLYYIVNIRDITHYKNTHRRLLLKTYALNTTNEATYIMVNERFIQVNDGACKMLGYTREEFTSMSLYDIDPDADPKEIASLIQNMKTTGAMRFERKHRTKEGSLVDVEIIANFFEYEGVGYSLAVARDISERLQLEAQKDNERMRLFFEKQLIGMAITSVDKKWLNVNDKLCEILGFTKDELMSKTLQDIVCLDDTNYFFGKIDSIIKGDLEEVSTQQCFVHKNGNIIHTNLMITCIRTKEGLVDYFLMLMEDITEQLSTQKALKESEHKFRTLVENATDNIIRYDIQARIIYVNPRLEAVLGVPYEQLINKTLTQFIQGNDYQKYEEILKNVISTGKDNHAYLTLLGDEGETYHFVQVVAERDMQGDIIGAIAFGRDVTKLTERTKELEKALELNESIIHAIPDLLLEITGDGTYVGVWAQDEKLLVQQKELLLGRNFKDILPENAKNAAIKTMQEVDEYGFSVGNTYSLDFPDGKRWFELSVSKRKSSNTYMVLARDITKRKLAQDALMELTQTLEDRVARRTQELQNALAFNEGIINAIPDLLFELDIHGNYLNVWTQNEKLLADQKELLLGKTLFDVLSIEAADTLMRGIKEADVKGSSFGHIIKIELPQGVRYFEESISKKVPENTFIILSRDITDRQNAQIELKTREEKFSKLFKLSPAAISITSLETGAYLDVNESFLHYTKYTYSEVVGKSSAQLNIFVNPKDRDAFFHQITHHGVVKDFQYPFRAKDGSIGYAIAYASTILYKGERCLIAHSYDMSDRKKFEQSEEAFRAIVENSPDVVARYDLEYRRTYVNPRMQKLLNKSMEEIIGHRPSEHTPLPKNIDFEDLLKRVTKEKVERHFVTPYLMPNGEERWGDIRVIPEFDEKKEVMSILMIGKDLDTYIPPLYLRQNLIGFKE